MKKRVSLNDNSMNA